MSATFFSSLNSGDIFLSPSVAVLLLFVLVWLVGLYTSTVDFYDRWAFGIVPVMQKLS